MFFFVILLFFYSHIIDGYYISFCSFFFINKVKTTPLCVCVCTLGFSYSPHTLIGNFFICLIFWIVSNSSFEFTFNLKLFEKEVLVYRLEIFVF